MRQKIKYLPRLKDLRVSLDEVREFLNESQEPQSEETEFLFLQAAELAAKHAGKDIIGSPYRAKHSW